MKEKQKWFWEAITLPSYPKKGEKTKLQLFRGKQLPLQKQGLEKSFPKKLFFFSSFKAHGSERWNFHKNVLVYLAILRNSVPEDNIDL